MSDQSLVLKVRHECCPLSDAWWLLTALDFIQATTAKLDLDRVIAPLMDVHKS